MNTENQPTENTSTSPLKILGWVLLALFIIIPAARLLFFAEDAPANDTADKVVVHAEVPEGADFNTLINLGLEYYNNGAYEASLEPWQKALELQPNSPLALNNIASSLILLGRYDEAIALLEQAIVSQPDNQLFRNNLKWAQDEKAKR